MKTYFYGVGNAQRTSRSIIIMFWDKAKMHINELYTSFYIQIKKKLASRFELRVKPTVRFEIEIL